MNSKKKYYKCSYCNNYIEQYITQGKRYKNHFCNKKCFYSFQKGIKRSSKIVQCKYCKKEFYQMNCLILENGNCCSRKCYALWMSKNWKGKNNPHYGNKWNQASKDNMSKNWHKSSINRARKLKLLNKNKKRFGKYNPMFGKKQKKETIEKIRIKNKISGLGRKHTKETIAKMKISSKLAWTPERTKLMMNENNHQWKGGKTFEIYPREFNDKLKEKIRRRDNYICQNCGIIEEEHVIAFSYVLHVHHIDYNKQNCNEENLITLCNACNARANHNRDYWENFYKEKVNKIILDKIILK